MKTNSHLGNLKTAALAACLLVSPSSSAFAQSAKDAKYDANGKDAMNSEADLSDNHKIPPDPVGWLTAYPTIVKTGTKPTLSWSITYPSLVQDFIEVIAPGTINPTETVDAEVRVLGNGVTLSSANSNTFTFVDAEAWISFANSSWSRIFFGNNHNVNPSRVVWSRKNIQPGETLRFGGRFFSRGFGPFRHSTDGFSYVRTLVSGDTPPSNIPTVNAPSLEDFIKPYLGPDGKVNIGPMDVIVFMELTHNDNQQNDPGYDLQDMVLLVTFTSNKPKNNNGMGTEGLNSSNPDGVSFLEYDSDR